MNQTLLVLQSRTFWTLVVTFVVNVGNLLVPTLPFMWQALANVLLLALATYFHVNPSQDYAGKNDPVVEHHEHVDSDHNGVDVVEKDAKKVEGWVEHPNDQGWKGH